MMHNQDTVTIFFRLVWISNGIVGHSERPAFCAYNDRTLASVAAGLLCLGT